MPMSGEIRHKLMSSSKKVIDLLSIIEIKDVLSSWMNELFINVIHNIIENNVSQTQLFIVIKLFYVAVDVIEYLLEMPLELGLVFEGKLEHKFASLNSVKDLENNEDEN